jgi:hypothetical protein
VIATLSGATFMTAGARTFNSFTGELASDEVTFNLLGSFRTEYGYYYNFPVFSVADVVEQLGPTAYMVIDGTARVAISPIGLTGPLVGKITQIGGPPRFLVLGSCSARRLELVRR